MTLGIQGEVLGGHTHFRLFVGDTSGSRGLAGNLIMRNEEFDLFIKGLEKQFSVDIFIFNDGE